MKIQEAVELLQNSNFQLTALIWNFDECPIEELRKLYVPTGKEEEVIIAHKSATYLPFRMANWQDQIENNDYITLSIDEDFHLFIIIDKDKEPEKKEKQKTTEDYIDFIIENDLPGLLWGFDSCPLLEIKNHEAISVIEKDGNIVNADRCSVTLHHKDDETLVPIAHMDDYENIPIKRDFIITISRIHTSLDID